MSSDVLCIDSDSSYHDSNVQGHASNQGGTAEGARTCAGETSDSTYRTAQGYKPNEDIQIYLPKSGWLTMVVNDIDQSSADTLDWVKPKGVYIDTSGTDTNSPAVNPRPRGDGRHVFVSVDLVSI